MWFPADVLNNLPATLVTLPHVTRTANVWPLLFGLNAGPESGDHRFARGAAVAGVGACVGCARDAAQYSRVGAFVGVPAMVAGVAALTLRLL